MPDVLDEPHHCVWAGQGCIKVDILPCLEGMEEVDWISSMPSQMRDDDL